MANMKLLVITANVKLPIINDKNFVFKLVTGTRVLEKLQGHGDDMLAELYTTIKYYQDVTFHEVKTKLYLEIKHQD